MEGANSPYFFNKNATLYSQFSCIMVKYRKGGDIMADKTPRPTPPVRPSPRPTPSGNETHSADPPRQTIPPPPSNRT